MTSQTSRYVIELKHYRKRTASHCTEQQAETSDRFGNTYDGNIIHGSPVAKNLIMERMIDCSDLFGTLEIICAETELLIYSSRCGILRLIPESNTLKYITPPSLPIVYIEAVEGMSADPSIGSCEAVAMSGYGEIVENIYQHPNFTKHPELLMLADFQSCWSIPILSRDNQVVDTFIIYLDAARSPGDDELLLLASQVHFASIAIGQLQCSGEV